MIRSLNKFIKVVLIFTFFIFFNFLSTQNNINTIFAQSIETDTQKGNIEVFKFKGADIKIVIDAISQKAYDEGGKKISIVYNQEEVKGPVTINLEKINWQTALEAVLSTVSNEEYRYGYQEISDGIILVATDEELARRKEIPDMKTEVYELKYLDAFQVKKAIFPLLTGNGKISIVGGKKKNEEDEEDEGIKYEDYGKEFGSHSIRRARILLIRDARSNLPEITRAIEKIDVMPRQVLIEARIIEIDFDLTKKLGIDWDITLTASGAKRPHLWPFTKSSDSKYLSSDDFPSADSGLFAFGTLNASSLQATLQAIYSDTNTNILSRPKITTLDNHAAIIQVLTDDPVPNWTYNDEVGAYEINGFVAYTYGVTLAVIPQINKNDFITLDIEPQVSEKINDKEFVSSSGLETTIPVLTSQFTSTRVMVKNGKTLVIAGLIRDKKINTTSKVPLLGDIPFIGRLFRHEDRSTEKKNLLIFITPKIMTPQINKTINQSLDEKIEK